MIKKATEADIAIAGGGTPGLALALLLADAGLAVALVERHPPLSLNDTIRDGKEDGRTSALMQGSLNILRACGVWNKIKKFSAPLAVLRIIDDSGSKAEDAVEVDFHAGEIGLESFGANISNNLLRAALWEMAAARRDIRIVRGAVAGMEIDAGGITARLDDGGAIRARLLAGADGRQSAVRTLAGIDFWQRDYRQQAITCVIAHEREHDFTSTEFHRPSGPFTLVPLPGRRSSVVWVDFTEPAAAHMTLGRSAFTRALQERSRDRLGRVELAGTPQAWPLMALRARTLTAPRVALAAEAAHVLHPLGAQGMNLSLRDIAALAETIVDAARLGADIGSAATLQRYRRRRQADIAGRLAGSDGLTRMVSNDYGAARRLRRAGLKTLDIFPGLKTMAMNEGLAPRDPHGRLLAGRGL